MKWNVSVAHHGCNVGARARTHKCRLLYNLLRWGHLSTWYGMSENCGLSICHAQKLGRCVHRGITKRVTGLSQLGLRGVELVYSH